MVAVISIQKCTHCKCWFKSMSHIVFGSGTLKSHMFGWRVNCDCVKSCYELLWQIRIYKNILHRIKIIMNKYAGVPWSSRPTNSSNGDCINHVISILINDNIWYTFINTVTRPMVLSWTVGLEVRYNGINHLYAMPKRPVCMKIQ